MYRWVRDVYMPEYSVRGSHTTTFWMWMYATAAVQTCLQEFMFVSQIAFFAQVSDVTVGGTYMTFFNTVANFGNLVSFSHLVLACLRCITCVA